MPVGDYGSIASAFVAVVALILAWVSLQRTDRFNQRQNEFLETSERLNQLLIERENAEGLAAKRALLSANLVEIAAKQYRLRVSNRGQGTARNVRLADLNGSRDSCLVASDLKMKFPVPRLEQHQTVAVVALRFLNANPRAHIKLVWNDDAGDDHEKELTPSW
jgi:hypothetical protein